MVTDAGVVAAAAGVSGTSAGVVVTVVGVLAAEALVDAGVGAAWGPSPHAGASRDQIIANTISAQRSCKVLCKEVVPSGVV